MNGKGARERRRGALTHVDAEGRARMVDVSAKDETERVARARARVRLSEATRLLVREGAIAKGDVLQVARIAGIQAAKRTHELIPLCHPLRITSVSVSASADEPRAITIETEVRARDRTGVEMEALVAASVAALAVYDMVKAVERGAAIEEVVLLEKAGGKSGRYVRRAGKGSRERT